MSKKYTYSRGVSLGLGIETFTAVEFDSFDEAIKAVDKGVADRKNEVEKLNKPAMPSIPIMQQNEKPTFNSGQESTTSNIQTTGGK